MVPLNNEQLCVGRMQTDALCMHLQVLGDHVDQKGSIVQPDRLRFDFSHSGPIDGPTLGRIENICNEELARKLQIYAKDCALADARQINGETCCSCGHDVSCSEPQCMQ